MGIADREYMQTGERRRRRTSNGNRVSLKSRALFLLWSLGRRLGLGRSR